MALDPTPGQLAALAQPQRQGPVHEIDLGTTPPQLTHHEVRVRGIRVHVVEAGEGPALVLQHGFPQDWHCWTSVIGALAEHHRVICPDMRGFGQSDAPPFGYEKETLAQDLLAVVDALGVQRFSLAGHDWGGVVSFIAALRAPARIDRLVLLNTAHLFWQIDAAFARAIRGFWYMPLVGTPLLGPWLLRRRKFLSIALGWAHPGLAWDAEERQHYLGQFDQRARRSAARRLYGSYAFREVAEIVRGRYKRERLTVPTLMLHGDGDRAIRPPLIRGHEPYADDLRVELISGAGHFVVEAEPERVATKILEFLRHPAAPKRTTPNAPAFRW